ncbi:MAG: 50S ribosomal protein L6 [Betaproteobacteria bacterium]|nr:50S ribosomal protein L6 [Betaproteobacteria bacterium]
MSRVGKLPVKLPAKVEVSWTDAEVTVKGPLGTLTQAMLPKVGLVREGDEVTVTTGEAEGAGAMHGTMRALLANMVKGVSSGYERKLLLVGVGYRAQAAGDTLNLTLGFSHPVAHKMPAGIKVETPQQTEILIKGADKQQVGQVAAEIRAYRRPEPYKGKGIRYADEVVTLKETKKK